MLKSIVLLPFVVAVALAGHIALPVAELLPQYTQTQNTATGEYGYSYSGGPSAKTEFRALDGTTTGSYSYIDAHGILQTTNYIADEFGFRVAGTNVPTDGLVPLDAPDVAEAKARHFEEHSRAAAAALVHQRKKRGIFTPVAHVSALPVATSSQSRVQIHKDAKIIQEEHHLAPALAVATPIAHAAPALLLRKKRGLLSYAAPVFASTIEHLPYATSRQDRFQIHNNAKLIQEEYHHAPVYAAAPVVETRAALALPAPAPAPIAPLAAVYHHLPYATSRQDRFQIHNNAKLIQEEYHHAPVYAPVFPALPAAPAVPALPALPSNEYLPAAPAAPALPALPSNEYLPAQPTGPVEATPQPQPAPQPAPQPGPQPPIEASVSDDAISVESA